MNTFFTTMGVEWLNILYTIMSEFVFVFLLHELYSVLQLLVLIIFLVKFYSLLLRFILRNKNRGRWCLMLISYDIIATKKWLLMEIYYYKKKKLIESNK